ncbi:MAG: Hsp20/alpha crystallin family protein [Chloroflexi bacterium]|nr:MAG: Hsp20/alpha crystallin family protein [Chloroflexota bacterium]
MTAQTKELQVKEPERITPRQAEPTRDRLVFEPAVDIFETPTDVVIVADMPGVDEKSVDITLDRNILTIRGFVEPDNPENYSMIYEEYEVGDYERSFTISNQIDRNNIQATVKNGVLQVWLPKVDEAKARKIQVKAG